MLIMQEGTVKWFDLEKGFGFISPKSGEKDIFLHISDLQASGYVDIEQGDFVEFEIESTQKGIRAVNITIYDFI